MPDEFTVETSNGTFAVEDTGPPGTPVVLLHGAITNLRAWDRVIPALGPDLRAVARRQVLLPVDGNYFFRFFLPPFLFSPVDSNVSLDCRASSVR